MFCDMELKRFWIDPPAFELFPVNSGRKLIVRLRKVVVDNKV